MIISHTHTRTHVHVRQAGLLYTPEPNNMTFIEIAATLGENIE